MSGDILFYMDVSFEEEKRYAIQPNVPAQSGGVTGLVLRLGLAKDAKGVQQVLILTLILCVGITGIVWLFAGGSEATLTPEEYEARTQNVNQVPRR